VIQFAYDADGNRVSKAVTEGGNTTTTLFLIDDLNPTGYAQVIEELVSINSEPSTINRKYLYGYRLIRQELNNGGGNWALYYYGFDGHASVRFLADNEGNITDTYTYDAFGILIGQTGQTPNNVLYAGEYYDSDLGLSYNRARYYSPALGRFWTLDSFEGSQSDPLSLHKYLYAHCNPINNLDPTGRETLGSMTVTAGGIAGLSTTVNAAITHASARAMFLLARAIISSDKIIFFFEAGTTAIGAGAIIANGAVQLSATAFEAVADMTEKVTQSYLNNTRQIPAGWATRGIALEQLGAQHLGEAYLGGNVQTIDVFEGGGSRVVASFKSHGLDANLPDLEGRYIAAFARDAEALLDIETRTIRGIRTDGFRFELPPGTLDAKVVYAPIPENHSKILLSSRVSTALREVAQRTRTIIVPVPVKNWRK
jgi:RHS repeat-associated protein